MASNGDRVWFNIELAEGGFIGEIGYMDGEEDYVSDQFVATNIGSLWLIAKEKMKNVLGVEDKEE